MARYNEQLVAQVKNAKIIKKSHRLFFFRLAFNRWMSKSFLIGLIKFVDFLVLGFYGFCFACGERYDSTIYGLIISAVVFLFLITRKLAYKMNRNKGLKKGYFQAINKCLNGAGPDFYDNKSINQIIKLLKRGKASSIQDAVNMINQMRYPAPKQTSNSPGMFEKFIEWNRKQKIKDQQEQEIMYQKARAFFGLDEIEERERNYDPVAEQRARQYYANKKALEKEAHIREFDARKAAAYNPNSYEAKFRRNQANAAAARAKKY